MNKRAITFAQLTARLESAIHYPCGEKGFQILMYGWIQKRRIVSRETLRQRKKDDGEPWLSYYEALSFSHYAGYDLTKN